MRTWMIRHPNMTFTRPMPESEIIKMIEAGEVSGQDEIAPATGYWFSLQEVEEVKAHFGDSIILQALIPTGSDTTSSTNTALIAKTPKTKITQSAIKRDQPKIVRATKNEGEEVSHTTTRFVFGLLMAAIFLGTLSLLWLGSR
jgi:hypothetical protein